MGSPVLAFKRIASNLSPHNFSILHFEKQNRNICTIMKPDIKNLVASSLFLVVSRTDGHGLMEDPPSRNWICGVVTKPDHVDNGVAVTPECGQAFDFQDGGYQFMSVLTHDVGRTGGPSNNVCGFDSETWFGASTPWDAPMDWPKTPMAPGWNEIKWNIGTFQTKKGVVHHFCGDQI